MLSGVGLAKILFDNSAKICYSDSSTTTITYILPRTARGLRKHLFENLVVAQRGTVVERLFADWDYSKIDTWFTLW